MIALWMIYATLVATILAVAATVLDHAAGAVLRQRRWLWILALSLSAGIPGWSAITRRAGGLGDTHSGMGSEPKATAAVRSVSVVPQQQLAELIARAKPESLGRLDGPLTVVWAATAVLALAAYAIAMWSLARRRRTWRATEVDGQMVLLTPATGPAVIGALRPAIVVPEWSLGLTAEQRSLMLDHEREHVAARDPLMLHAAAVVALLMPWNAGAWWLYRRLRLAVELDCDARVLSTGRDPARYGNLLLDVCARRVGSGTVLAPALFERTSSLTRRILAMYPARPRFARTRLALGATAAFAVAVLACDMPSPEALAPDGTNQASKRLYGQLLAKPEAEPQHRTDDTKAIVSRYFPAAALGNAGPSILFLVKSATGVVVLTEAQPASELARMPLRMSGKVQVAGELGIRERKIVEEKEALLAAPTELRMALPRQRRESRPPLLFKVPSAPGWVPAGIGALRPDDIASIDVSKHAAGTVAPKAVSLITITLKPAAVVPSTARP